MEELAPPKSKAKQPYSIPRKEDFPEYEKGDYSEKDKEIFGVTTFHGMVKKLCR